jgi:hypothetical protein
MKTELDDTSCPGCGVVLPRGNYCADNRYGVTSVECRELFDKILVREHELFGYPAVHRLLVDAYMVQHPPRPRMQHALGIDKRLVNASVQSVGIHLLALYAALERQMDLRSISRTMGQLLNHMDKQKWTFPQLAVPVSLGQVRVTAVYAATYVATDITLTEYECNVRTWAEQAWHAWHAEHATVRSWYDRFMG